jgi:hypothetical protein
VLVDAGEELGLDGGDVLIVGDWSAVLRMDSRMRTMLGFLAWLKAASDRSARVSIMVRLQVSVISEPAYHVRSGVGDAHGTSCREMVIPDMKQVVAIMHGRDVRS